MRPFVLGTPVTCAKTTELMKMPFGADPNEPKSLGAPDHLRGKGKF